MKCFGKCILSKTTIVVDFFLTADAQLIDMISGTCTSRWDWPVEGAILSHVTGEGILPRGVAFGGEVAFKCQIGVDFQWRNGSNAETLNSEVPCSRC
ncbi:hypothetical protein TNCT_320771 [Trichonephila clavata]|uniref:Uncharacterized protein n=1 Tax=Trichonephila clavata TaxID=2740835 RepID=A0A8X6LCJ7_TRICU|nr:hypothetical protein TNCT_320771 [Trichonephila clavata]